ncbi:MAG: hypothetical protein GXP49_12155 [Deltaproteobacteria bacterium]|nr:hypothetical protein [Deltaproteobacteria bacterium]
MKYSEITVISISVLSSIILSSFGCGDNNNGGICPGDTDLVPNLVEDETDLDTFKVASLSINALNKLGAQTERDTQVQAHFSDFIEYRIYVSDRISYSATCEVYTSQPVTLQRCRVVGCDDQNPCPEGYSCMFQDCRPTWKTCTGDDDCPGGIMVCEAGYCVSPPCCTNPPCREGELDSCPKGFECTKSKSFPLEVNSVSFKGLKGGEVKLEPKENGNIEPRLINELAFQDGNKIEIQVDSSEGQWSYPAFSMEMDVPEDVVMTRFDKITNPVLEESPSLNLAVDREDPLWISWVPGNGDYMVFTLTPKAGTETPYGKLRCVTFDDGCLRVPAEALDHLALDKATNFKMKLDRHLNRIWSKKTGGTTDAAALVDLSFSLEAVVGR